MSTKVGVITSSSPPNKKSLTQTGRLVIFFMIRYFYWTSWDMGDETSGRVWRTSMDGLETEVILDGDSVRWPNGVTIDYASNTLYTIDAQRDELMKSNLNGENLEVIQTLLNSTVTRAYPFSLEFHQGTLYWSEWFSDSIYSVRDGAPEGSVQQVVSFRQDPGQLNVLDIARQPRSLSEFGCFNFVGGYDIVLKHGAEEIMALN